jgi:hypothetical protein
LAAVIVPIIVKMTILLKTIYRLQFLSNFNSIFHGNRKINPKIHLEAQKTPNSQSNPKQKE